jgi:hypothetical protein
VETFVIQIWNQPPRGNEANGELRGYVEHLGSGRRESFRDERALLAFLHAQQRQPQQEVGE